MKTVRVSLVTKACTLGVGAIVAACGGNQPQPNAASPSPTTNASAETPAASTEPAPPATAAASTSAPTPATPASDETKPPSPKAAAAETKDECTPVGVDFEKRARPKLKECYATAKKKNPNLEGTVKIKMTVDVKGKLKNVKVIDKTLPDGVADCMLKVVKTTPFPEVEKCWDASLTIPITFPTPP